MCLLCLVFRLVLVLLQLQPLWIGLFVIFGGRSAHSDPHESSISLTEQIADGDAIDVSDVSAKCVSLVCSIDSDCGPQSFPNWGDLCVLRMVFWLVLVLLQLQSLRIGLFVIYGRITSNGFTDQITNSEADVFAHRISNKYVCLLVLRLVHLPLQWRGSP